MFIAFYRWKLKPGKEEQFRAAWSEVTLAIRTQCGSLGSRLHQAEDGTWAAYAQWPTRAQWEADRQLGASVKEARQRMRDAVAESLPDLYMTVTDDFLVPKTP
ncbi:MAG: hypothetical protein FD126_272 [Elusimicrobia bacterium]|nr:MAG: hypothetical protein FD126_272 [Elusimicrobiota bacterium]